MIISSFHATLMWIPFFNVKSSLSLLHTNMKWYDMISIIQNKGKEAKVNSHYFFYIFKFYSFISYIKLSWKLVYVVLQNEIPLQHSVRRGTRHAFAWRDIVNLKYNFFVIHMIILHVLVASWNRKNTVNRQYFHISLRDYFWSMRKCWANYGEFI